MHEERIVFPRQATVAYIDSLLKAVRQVISIAESRVILDLSTTTEASSLCLCFLCALRDLSLGKNNQISLVLPRNKRVAEVIRSVWEIFQSPKAPIKIAKRMCQMRKITGNNNAGLEEILNLLNENIPMKAGVRNSLLVVLTELLTNAIDHSGERSCYVCAGAWGKSKSLHITLLDFGMGIPQKIRTRYPEYENDSEAMKVLMEKGLTTRTQMEGGRGYRFIQDILKENKGRLHVFSGRAKTVMKYDKGEYHYREARKLFTGTCVDIQFRLDGNNLYTVLCDTSQEEFF